MSLNHDKHSQILTTQFADMAQAEARTFSMKTVSPCMVPQLQYSHRGTVQNGGEAQLAYQQAAAPQSTELKL